MIDQRYKASRPWIASAVLFIAVMSVGCRSWLFYPDQSPGWTLAKRLREPDKVVEWTLRQRDGWDVFVGVSGLLSFVYSPAGSDSELPPVEIRLAVIDGLGRIARKRATGWPDEALHPLLKLPLMYSHAAQIANTLDDPAGAYSRVEPADRASASHIAWVEAGVEFGVIRR